MGGNIPEEDGVDHRVEPSMWLADGSAEGAQAPEAASAAPQPPSGGRAGDDGPLPTDLPMSGNGYAADRSYGGQGVPYTGQQDAAYGAASRDGGTDSRSQPDKAPPYGPAGHEASYGAGQASYGAGQAPRYGAPGQESAANGDGVRVPPYQPQVPPLPAQVPPGPSPGVAARVTGPFAALTGAKAKPKKPDRPARPANPRPVPNVSAADRVGPGARPLPKGSPASAPTRRAQLVLSRIEPWSVMKFSFMISLVGWVILFVAVAALYYVLSKLGVFHSIQSTVTDVTSSKGSAGSDANAQWFSASRILGYTMLVGAVNVVLITALATVGAVIYNLVTYLAGGIEVTLKETD